MENGLRCPKCGSTRFRVISLDAVEQHYDAVTREWGDCDFLDDVYLTQVYCAECGVELAPEGSPEASARRVILGYRTIKHLLREVLRVVVVYPWPDEGEVLAGVEGDLKVVYHCPSDAGPYAASADEVGEALCQALHLTDFDTIEFEELAPEARAFDVGTWENVPEVVARIMARHLSKG